MDREQGTRTTQTESKTEQLKTKQAEETKQTKEELYKSDYLLDLSI